MKKKVDHNPDLDRLPDWASKYKLGGKGPTAKQLIDSGFCRIQASADVKDCIARLDKKTWMEHVSVEFPGSAGWELSKCAHMYRTRLAKGFRNVPKTILDQLPESISDDAPVMFLYHWSFKGEKVEVPPPPKPAKKPAKKAAAKPVEAAPPPAPESVKPEPIPGYDMFQTSSGEWLQVPHAAMLEAHSELAEPEHEGDDAEWEEVKQPETPRPLPSLEPVAEMPFGTANGALSSLNGMGTTAMKVVVVTFTPTGAQEYYYFAPVDTVVGDYAVVYRKASENAINPFSIGLIERDDPDLEGKARQAILGVFNEAFANSVQARMDQLVQIKARLIQKRREYDERQIYELMAAADPEARELLDMLQRLEGEL